MKLNGNKGMSEQLTEYFWIGFLINITHKINININITHNVHLGDGLRDVVARDGLASRVREGKLPAR